MKKRILWMLIVSALILFEQPVAQAVQHSTPSTPPNQLVAQNIVFILADDLGYRELGCYGQTKIPTPHIDQLAKEGMKWTLHYSGAPVCAPARCVLMTGQHLGHAEIRGNQQARKLFPQFLEGQHPISEDVITLPMVLKNNGFVTGAMGKWGLGPVGSTGSPHAKGIDEFYGYNCQAVAHSYFPRYLWHNDQQVEINRQPIPGSARQPQGDVVASTYRAENYAPYLMIKAAEEFIDQHKDQRFFLYLPFIEPHVAMHPPQDALDRFPADWDQVAYRGGNGYLPHPRPRAAYAAMISDLDQYVGRVVTALENAGILDETLIVFTSDNGATHEGVNEPAFHIGGADTDFFNSTGELKGYKGSVYEGGIRVPMIARLKGVIEPGSINETPSYFADWFPTLCHAVGITQMPSSVDGQSLWPAMTEQLNITRTKPMLWFYPEYGGQVAVRIDHWKILRRGLKTKQPQAWEIYDLNSDPQEAHNVASEHRELIERAVDYLHQEVSENKIFPMAIPTVD